MPRAQPAIVWPPLAGPAGGCQGRPEQGARCDGGGVHGSRSNIPSHHLARGDAGGRSPWRMARHDRRALPRVPAGQPRHPAAGGGRGVRRLLHAQPHALPAHRDHAPGDPEPARSAPGADLRTDLPGYRIYRKGELAEQRGDIRDLWRDDLVAFLLGCSLTFEHALIEAGVPVRNVECDTMVPCSSPTSPASCGPLPWTDGGDHASHP